MNGAAWKRIFSKLISSNTLPNGASPLESLKSRASFTILNSSFHAEDVSTLVVFFCTNMNLGPLSIGVVSFFGLNEDKVAPKVSKVSSNLLILSGWSLRNGDI